jgi:hypothetical protein
MRGLRKFLFALALAAAAAPAVANAAERLVLEPYPGPPAWKQVTNDVSGPHFLWEFIPADQTIGAYRDIVSAESFPNLRGADPAAFLRSLFPRFSGACVDVRVNGPTPRQQGGYAIAYAQIMCSQEVGKPTGAVMFFKVIQGDEALYVVQREIRTPPSKVAGVFELGKDKAAAMAFMTKQSEADRYIADKVYLCGARATDPRCKAGAR